MKHLITMLIAVLMLCSCRSTKNVTEQTVCEDYMMEYQLNDTLSVDSVADSTKVEELDCITLDEVVVWATITKLSAPDSTGVQHATEIINLNLKKNHHEEQHKTDSAATSKKVSKTSISEEDGSINSTAVKKSNTVKEKETIPKSWQIIYALLLFIIICVAIYKLTNKLKK